jgi:CRISPR-associated endonuclease/helicase Cas3
LEFSLQAKDHSGGWTLAISEYLRRDAVRLGREGQVCHGWLSIKLPRRQVTEYFARSENAAGVKHDLVRHLTDVAEQARTFAEKFDGGEFGYWAGLWHDLGKFTQAFQDYLAAPTHGHGPDHSTAGAIHAVDIFDEVARAVAGHHSGLPDSADLERRVNDPKKKQLAREAVERAQAVPAALRPDGDLSAALPPGLFAGRDLAQSKRNLELFSRMVFSSLADADFLDTEKHFESSRHATRSGSPSLHDLWALFERDQNQLSTRTGSRLQQIRHEIYESCLEAAEEKQGIFSLTVPTGGGKTRSSLGFAIKHALRWGLDRIIVAIPYTSIIDQTADVYRTIFRQENQSVLEHHSAVTARREQESDPVSLDEVWLRLASENWDAPIIVTTTNQLFESLFANRPTRCRKLHNIARSVLILDEVQTLPVHLLTPILDILQTLSDQYRVSIVLCTATQPALTSNASFQGLREVREIIRDPARYFRELQRVDYESHVGEPWTWEQVAEEMRTEQQCLTIVNTKKDAFALLDVLTDDPSVLHLSTQMCGVHRLETLKEVRQRLSSKLPCRLVSTQVVEAGVDLDFPLVLRAVGPLDRIVQAAGRCNREARLEKDGYPVHGRVIVFEPKDGGVPPGMYETAMCEAVSMLRRGCDLHSPATYEVYFRQLFGAVGAYLDRHQIQAARTRFDFPLVAQKFRLIEDDTELALVRPPWGDHQTEVDRLLDLVRTRAEVPRWLFRKIQPYVVSIRKRVIPAYQREHLLQEIIPDTGIWEWLGRYDKVRGLVAAPLSVEELVVAT